MNAQQVSDKLRAMKYDDELIALLVGGVSRSELHALLESRDPSTDVDLQRMNLLGGLRASGFLVEGKRAHEIVRVTDWVEREYQPSCDQWQGLSREALLWVESLSIVDESYEARFRDIIEGNQPVDPPLHESCWLDLYAYELGPRARTGYIFSSHSLEVVILRKFNTRPRFSLYVVGMSPGSETKLAELARRVALASVKPVQIKHLFPGGIPALKSATKGWVGGILECMYDMVDIVEHPEKYWNKRGLSTLRARERDTSFTLEMPVEDQERVIDEWKSVNAQRQRQVAIGRDYIAARSSSPHKITMGGYREGRPVSHTIFDTFAHRPDTVALINEKSLNYSTMAGGKYGLSDWAQLTTCRELVSRGFRFQQAGGMLENGDRFLREKKEKFIYGEPIFVPWFTVDCPLSEYA